MTHSITIVGLGAGELDQLPLGIYKLLKQAGRIYARTVEHPAVTELREEGVQFISLDHIYEKHDQFAEVYEEIADELEAAAAAEKQVVYAVPGHPIIAEKTVQILIDRGVSSELEVRIAGGHSFLDSLLTAVEIDPIDGFQFLDGTALMKEDINIFQHLIIAQVYDSFVASEVKLTLMEKYPDEHAVYMVTAAGSAAQTVKKVPLYELDHQVELNNLTSLYVPPIKQEEHTYREFSVLRQIIAKLRSPQGCPWDREQTHESLKKYLIEESYELLDAIDRQNDEDIVEELGDVLLQVLLHAQIGEDEGMFSIEDVVASLAEKMVRRHPHVFGETDVRSAQEVMANWQAIKQQEKGEKDHFQLDEVEKGLPALLRAYELQRKAAKAGFDWDEAQGAIHKAEEEWQEFLAEVTSGNSNRQLEEFGDVLFSFVNVARFYSIHPEEALAKANEKFCRRFSHVEKRVKASGRAFQEFTLSELDAFWEEAKKTER